MGMYEAAKDAIALARKADNIELVQQVIDAQGESRADRERIRALTEENAELKRLLQLQGELRWEHNVYWREIESEAREGPYCPKCWHGEQKVARLAEREAGIYWWCFVCALKVLRPGKEAPRRPGRRVVYAGMGW